MTQATGRATLQSRITDSVRQGVKTFEEQCREFNTFRQKALNDIGVRLGRINYYAADIDAKLASGLDDGTGEISQLRRRTNEAKKTIMQSIKYCVTDEDTIRLRVEHKAAVLNQNSIQALLPIPSQGSSGVIPNKKPPQHQTIGHHLENQESSSRIQKPFRGFDVESDEVMNAPHRNKRKDQPPAAKRSDLDVNKKRQRTEVETIHIQNVKNAFIFEYPYNTSLLWILRCSPCNFEAKRNPLTATSNVISHWNSRHRQGTTIQEILENHLVHVIGGSIDDARKKNIEIGAIGELGCQPRRVDAPRYTIPEFINPLLSCNKRQKRANSPLIERDDRQLHTKPDPAVQESQAAMEVEYALPHRPRQTLLHLAYEPPMEPRVEDNFANLLRKRPLHSPSLTVPSSERLVNSLNSNALTSASSRKAPVSLCSHPPHFQIADPPQADSTWHYRSTVHRTRRLMPAYENGRDTAEYVGLNTG
ncbi:hypothetical protein FHL15_004957 [Xylaria flabelliformis]|uniref:Uncharacterized protein n=1 Tax=Xylaria flabelliformis TaxID=2512241 RepID=A0A553I1V9_9PEZI|nr:hypothetical protein FHL15_004957 [Xylaria flabelliformis]